MSGLHHRFQEAAQKISSLPSSVISNDDKLNLYGWYKRAISGAVDTNRPSLWKAEARAKWDAWKSVESLSPDEAMQAYVEAVKGLVPGWEPTSLPTEPEEVEATPGIVSRVNPAAVSSAQTPLSPPRLSVAPIQACSTAKPLPSPKSRGPVPCRPFGSAVERVSSCLPWSVHPRKRLDISLTDLGSLLVSCLARSEGARAGLEHDLAQVWGTADGPRHTLLCLSVRSAWDLLLTTLRLEEGAEVVMGGVTIPDMVRLTRCHGLVPVPVDLDPATLSFSSLQALRDAITPRTRLLVVTHLFGAVTDLAPLAALASEKGLLLIEDCAQAFSAAHFRGHAQADVSLFSFGTIKTSTALAGAVVRFRDAKLCARVRRLETTLPLQPTRQVVHKALRSLLLHCLSTPAACGLLCRTLGSRYDALVTQACRGFATSSSSSSAPTALLHAIRRRPCVATLALLRRRLRGLAGDGDAYVQARAERAREATRLLQDVAGIRVLGSRASLHTWWLLPVQVTLPEVDLSAVANALRRAGYDATTGATQLGTVAAHTPRKEGEADPTPRATEMMRQVLYLPVGPEMSTHSLRGLRSALVAALDSSLTSRRSSHRLKALWPLALVLLGGVLYCLGPCACLLLLTSLCGAITLAMALLARGRHSASPLLRHCITLSDEQKRTALRDLDSLYPSPASTSGADPSLSTEGATVLLTGATGFVGQMVCATLLRQAAAALDSAEDVSSPLGKGVRVSKIVLLIRSKRGADAASRWAQLRRLEVFAAFPAALLDDVIAVVAGDVALPDCGLSEACSRSLQGVTHVIHGAACVQFDMPLVDAAATNIGGALRVQALAKSLPKCRRLIHVSTAFVHPHAPSFSSPPPDPLPATLVSLGGYEAGPLYESMLGTQWLALQAMKRLGFANSYVLTKCVGEHLLAQARGQLELVIVRPPIVGPSWASPRPGWSGSKPSTLTACLCLRLKGLIRVFPFPPIPAALTPVDVVSHVIVCSALAPPSPPSKPTDMTIRHASWQCPQLTWHRVSTLYYEQALLARSGHKQGGPVAPALFLLMLQHAPPSLYPTLHALLNLLPLRLYQALIAPLPASLVKAASLPSSYFPFMTRHFTFASPLAPPPSFNPERYLLDTLTQSESFVSAFSPPPCPSPPKPWVQVLGPPSSPHAPLPPLVDLLYCLMRPCGSLVLRLTAWLTTQTLSRCLTGLFVHLPSFAAVEAALHQRVSSDDRSLAPVVVLLPTHRSYLDFILLSLLRFRHPQLGHGMPRIAAASDAFGHTLAWLMTWLGAFFVRRTGAPDPTLQACLQHQLHHPHDASTEAHRSYLSRLWAWVTGGRQPDPTVLEVFVEGTRSRDRRFRPGKTGVLRCILRQAGDRPILLVPITLSYDLVPEQASLAADLQNQGGRSPGHGNLRGLLTWASHAWAGKIRLGSVFVAAGTPVWAGEQCSQDVKALVATVQQEQRRQTVVTAAHVRAACEDWHLTPEVVTSALRDMGVHVVMEVGHDVALPSDAAQRWMLHCQWLGSGSAWVEQHFQRQEWAAWLRGIVKDEPKSLPQPSAALEALLSSAVASLDEVEQQVSTALQALAAQGYRHPTPEHVLQYGRGIHGPPAAAGKVGQEGGDSVAMPIQLVKAVLERSNAREEEEKGGEPGAAAAEVAWHTLQPAAAAAPRKVKREDEAEDGEEAYGAWGFRDSRFVVDQGDAVVMQGQRYPLSGRRLSGLLPFFQAELGVGIDARHAWLPYPCPNPSITDALELSDRPLLLQRLLALLPGEGQVSVDVRERCRHGTGHALEDMVRLRTGQVGRVPDVVLYPQSQDEVLSLVELAREETLCLVPFGGGTNVSLALQCPRGGGGRRVVACVDMRRMGRVLWVNEEDGLAEVQAGVVGRQLQRQLARRGLTIGHEPDSIEFSTLGGWIATRASGMKRSKYGNIEDMVVGVRVATVQGLAWQGPVGTDTPMTAAHRRASQGLELKHLVLGSEGNLGIITSAVIRVWPLPACQEYGAALLPSLDAGLSLMRAVSRLAPSLRPASIRLVDNAQFRLGRVLHQGQREGAGGVLGAAGGVVKPLLEAGQRWYLARQGLHKDRVVGLSMLFEGSRDEVGLQKTRVARLIEEAGGVQCGAQAGKVGYELTFGIAYIRDFALSYHVVGESFEAFVPWSTLHDTLASVAARVTATHADVGAQGRPFLSSRVTQVYEEGVCVYWYLALYARGAADPCAVFRRLERVAREEVAKRGGSVSHHHGVGKAKAHLLKQHGLSPAAVELMHCVKRGMDPTNVFGIGNGVMAIDDDAEDDKAAREARMSTGKAPVIESAKKHADIGIGVSECDDNVRPTLACKAAAGFEV